MEWIEITWIHKNEHFPERIFMEVADDRYNTRKVEFFKNGKIGYAIDSIEMNGTALNEAVFPSVEEYNQLNSIHSDPHSLSQLNATSITKEKFESFWKLATR